MTACLAMLHGENQICTIKFFIFMLFLVSRNPVPHQPFHFTSREFITYSTIRWQSANLVVCSPPCWSCLLKIGESLYSSELRFAVASFDQCRRDSTLEASVEALVAFQASTGELTFFVRINYWYPLMYNSIYLHVLESFSGRISSWELRFTFLKLFLTLTWFIWYRLVIMMIFFS